MKECMDCKKKIESGSRCNSCTVILHRQRMRSACVEYMGNKCLLCGYDKCIEAFDFHLEDDKDFLSSTQSWQKTFKYLQRCVMTCANCHREIHFYDQDLNHIQFPHNQNRFFDALKNNNLQPRMKGVKLKSIKKLDKRKRTRIDWPELGELVRMLQESSFLSVGKKLGVSDNAVRKHLKKNEVDYRKIKEMNEMYRNGNFEVVIKANGRVVESVEKNGKLYIVGDPGQEYTITVHNRTGRDGKAVVSVDGLSVMTGEDATTKEGGYLVRRYGSYTIRGWRLDNSEIAKFEFGEQGNVGESYAALSGKPKNIGVIGVAFYLRKEKPVYRALLVPSSKKYRRRGRDIEPYFYNLVGDTPRGGDFLGADSGQLESTGPFASAAGSEVQSKGLMDTAPAGGDMGTGFGKRASDEVREVEFERDMGSLTIISIEYGSRQNLIERGVIVEEPVTPNPFPGDSGCTPPKEWRG